MSFILTPDGLKPREAWRVPQRRVLAKPKRRSQRFRDDYFEKLYRPGGRHLKGCRK